MLPVSQPISKFSIFYIVRSVPNTLLWHELKLVEAGGNDSECIGAIIALRKWNLTHKCTPD